MNKYLFYKDLESKEFEFDPTTTLTDVRTALTAAGWLPATYSFLYYSTELEDEEIVPFKSEAKMRLQTVAAPHQGSLQVLLTNTGAAKPDLKGRVTNWFVDRNLQIAVSLNNGSDGSDPSADNQGKFEPVLLSSVESTNPAKPVNFTNAVICQKGSVITFKISSWGAAGYGFSIKSDKIHFVDALWVVNDGKYGTIVCSGVSRYQNQAQMIQVDSNASQSFPTLENVQYSEVRIRSWNVSAYKRGDASYQSDLQPGQHRTAARIMAFNAVTGPQPGTTPGNGGFAVDNSGTVIPGAGIESGSPHAGGASTATFGAISDVQQDNPDTATPLGEIVLYFLVFKDEESAKRIVQRLPAPTASDPY